MDFNKMYNDPIIGKKRKGSPDDPYLSIEETLQVISGRVVLTEVPNRFQKVRVTDGSNLPWFEVIGESTGTQYTVDYTEGVVFFDSIHNGKSLTFDYLGEGAHYFPAQRVYIDDEDLTDNYIPTAKDKFKQIDVAILEQKNRVDEQIRSVPQPSEVVDMRVDHNGKVFPVAKDRIDAEQIKIEEAYMDNNGMGYDSLRHRINGEQIKIENAYRDKNNVVFPSLKDRIDSEQTKIENAYRDKNNTVFPSLKDRIDSEQGKIEEAYKDKNNVAFSSLKNRIDAEQTKIENAYTDAKGTTYSSLSSRLNKIDENVDVVQSKTDKLAYKLISNETEMIGHRGQSAIAPENTIPSFQMAIANGFDSIECDVMFTSDGVPVLMHDSTVDRTTNGTGSVGSMTLSAIRGLDANYDMPFFAGTKVPTMDEYLQIGNGRSKYLYPEFKGYNNLVNDAKTFVDKIKAHNLEERTVVQCFTAANLTEIRKNSSKVILGYLAADESVFNLRLDYAEQDGNALVIVDCNVLFNNPSLVKKAFDRGIEVITYGTSRSRDLQQLYSYGIRRFITNDKQKVIS